MSVWSYISGIITVETYGSTQAQSRYILETVLDHLPVVSGSEQDMSVTVVSPSAIKSQTTNNTICVNEFGEKVPGKIFHIEYSPEYHIVLDASLRDRDFDRTLREFNKWLITNAQFAIRQLSAFVDRSRSQKCVRKGIY